MVAESLRAVDSRWMVVPGLALLMCPWVLQIVLLEHLLQLVVLLKPLVVLRTLVLLLRCSPERLQWTCLQWQPLKPLALV